MMDVDSEFTEVACNCESCLKARYERFSVRTVSSLPVTNISQYTSAKVVVLSVSVVCSASETVIE